MYLFYKFNFITDMYALKKSIYSVWFYPQFQASAGCLGTYILKIRGDNCILFLLELSPTLPQNYTSFRVNKM